MLKVLALLLAVQVVWGFPGQQIRIPTDRIVGGHDADIKDYPYQLALLLYNQHYCGAALIDRQWALTAAHCVDHGLYDTLEVRAGSSEKASGGQVIKVAKVVIHPDYDIQTANYDVAVLELAEPVTAANASVIQLPEPNQLVEEGEIAIVSGWGTLEYDGETPEILQVAEIPVVDYDTCKEIYGRLLTEAMFCAGLLNEGGKDACQGDSGGPVAIEGRLAGIVSWGSKCATPDYPGVYVDVAHVLFWIEDEINKPLPSTTPGPEPTTSGPETTTPGPETVTPEPETTTSGPETVTPEPETTTSGPETVTPEPETTTPGPETVTPEPETTTSGPEPTTPGPEPTTPGPEPTTPGPEPTTPEPTTPGPEPTTPGPEPTTPEPEPPSSSPEPPSPSPEPSSPSPEPSSPGPEPTSPGPEPSSPGPEPSSPGPEPTTSEPDIPTPGPFSFSRLLKLF